MQTPTNRVPSSDDLTRLTQLEVLMHKAIEKASEVNDIHLKTRWRAKITDLKDSLISDETELMKAFNEYWKTPQPTERKTVSL